MTGVEVSLVRKHVLSAIEQSRLRAKERRQRNADAEQAYRQFLDEIAAPLVRQLAHALKAEGYPFTVSTPSGSVRLTSEHGRDDYIELVLDTSGEAPTVLGRVHRTRGSRTVSEEHPVSPGTAPAAVTDEQLLTFLMRALEPWLER